MGEATVPSVVIEPVEKVDNGVSDLIVKYENITVHETLTLKCLDAMRKERQLCDVILTVEGHEIFAHRALLSCHSNYFLELFLNDETNTSTTKQMYYQIDGIEHIALKLIIQFIYQGSFQLASDFVPKVYLAAHQLRVDSISKACSIYLSEQLNEDNCLGLRIMAMDDELRLKATECIQQNFLSLLETREFHTLPSIKVELVDSVISNLNVMCELILHWIVYKIQKGNSTIQELSEYMRLLYLNDDKTLHDCNDMEENNKFFSDVIKDYQSYRVTKRSISLSSGSNNSNEESIFELPTPTNNSHTSDTQLIHVSQSTEYSSIAIAIVKGKLLSITIHTPPPASSAVNTPESIDFLPADKSPDDNHVINGFGSSLICDKDTPFASLSTARCCFGITSTNDAIHAVGGYDRGDCLDTIEQFDPVENKWNLLSVPMTSRRGRVSATIVNERIYVCGGSDGQKELDTGEYLDLRSIEKWISIKDLAKPVAHGAMCSDDHYVYLIGGCEGDRCKSDCYQYDPEKNLWSELTPMNCERSQAAVVHLNEKLYVFGGYTANRCLSSCEILTLATNEWSAGPTMREQRRGCGAILYEKNIFIIGGSNGVTSLASIEIFNPVTNEWLMNVNSLSGELNIPRVGLGIGLCHGKLYVIGGFDGRNFLKSIEVYDKDSQRWKLNYSKCEKS